MTRGIPTIGSALLLALAVATAAQQTPDRSAPPKPGPPPPLKVPPIEKRTLSNGVPVWIAGLHEVPIVQVNLVVKAGAAIDPPGTFGLANMTAELLDEGAGSRDALQLADAVDYLGADLSTGAGFDSSVVNLHLPVARLAEALPIMADVALRPSFPEKELQRIRDEALASLVQAQDDPASLIEIAFPRIVYGEKHRYGTIGLGTPGALKGLSVADVKQFHAARYTPDRAALIVAGDVTSSNVLPLLEKAFGSWKSTAPPPPPLPEPAQLTARQVFLLDKPGAAQSQIRIGAVGVPRSTPDYFPLRVLNTILGGSFTSRLNQNLREEHGYSYGASSAFEMRAQAGPFFAGAGVQTDKTSEALKEFFKELERIRKPVPADELEKAKNFVALLMLREFETTASLAGSLAQQFVYGLPDDYFATFTDRVRAVTAADVQRVAQTYIQPDRFALVLVGDRKVIEPGIRALNLGPIRVLTVDEIVK